MLAFCFCPLFHPITIVPILLSKQYHIHLLVEYDTSHSIAEVARAFKGRSSRLLRQEFSSLLRLPSLWSKSYFYETTGKISTAKIKAYIEDPHHW